MTNLPRRHIEPLAPAPDSFDKVFAGARRRRHRKLAAASATMVLALVAAGSFALGESLHVTHRMDPAAHSTGDTSPSAGLPQPTPSPAGSSKASRSVSAKTNSSAPITWLEGRAEDSAGHGIAGLYVQPGTRGQKTFSSNGFVAALTDSRGYFKIACPGAPVLLSTWRIDHAYEAANVGLQWGATFVGSATGEPVLPSCHSGLITTVLTAGATVTGQVIDSGPCLPGDAYDVWLWLGGNHATTIRLAGLHNGDPFTFSGLPAGTHTLGLRKQTTSFEVAPGAAVEANVNYTCPTPTPDPTDTSEPSSPPPSSDADNTPSLTPTPST